MADLALKQLPWSMARATLVEDRHRLCWFGIWQGRVETSRLDLRSLVPSLALSVDTYHRIIPKSIYLSAQRLDNKNHGSLSWDVSRTSYCVWGKGFKIFLVSKLRPPIPSVFHHLPTWLYSRWPTPNSPPDSTSLLCTSWRCVYKPIIIFKGMVVCRLRIYFPWV